MISSQDIRRLIPQREPMIMVDKLISADEYMGRSVFMVRKENIFVEKGALNASGMIENMAQTAAARMGYICLQENRPVPLGYIGAVQNLEILALPKINEQIETEISIKNQIFDITIVTAIIYANGKPLARGELKIFITNQP
jgi:predicted hotdog family 3-hydroxylacyl-ACP dehydratase